MLHVLHHAAERPIYGQWMLDELSRHGYAVSCGTLYPALHAMERRGWLRSRHVRAGKRVRKLYSITQAGADYLDEARQSLVELAREVLTPAQRALVAARRKRAAASQ